MIFWLKFFQPDLEGNVRMKAGGIYLTNGEGGSNRMSQLKKMAAQGIVLSLLIGLSGVPAMAEQVIGDLDDGVSATLKTDIDSKTAQSGQTFEAQLGDAVRYKDQTLPAGTAFRGQITKVQPGYVTLEVQEATLPSGQGFSFAPEKYTPRDKKTAMGTSGRGRIFLKGTVEQAPYTAAGLATTIPLRVTEAVTGPALIPIGLGVRMLTGATVGIFRHSGRYENKPAGYRVVRGALDGSGIPRIVSFITGRSDDAPTQMAAGDSVKLYFNEDGLRDLFQTADSGAAMQPETPAQSSASMTTEE